MKNTYVTGYFPLLSIMAFSLFFAVHLMVRMIAFLKSNGLYSGMTGLLSEIHIKYYCSLSVFLCYLLR
ncbi:hypothetical protein F7984_16235 [Pradoshia sp. D12]|uniref:hypothetical protein n=1 Tax=Pradoshia sp. D12 TaxID=2651284 RepID=UPI00124D69E8|nr:hypothetical protein [Pradoshia sp. D12]QFK72662.1 hypothetical protein F7984_16235 [Pradoshia sp. D12]